MRWPWQRGSAEPRTDRAPGEPAAPAAVEPPVAPAGWAFLPALQRTAGSIQLMSDPDRFTGSLASWGDPSFTGPMTHLVSTDAPAGVIDVDGGGPVTGSGGYAASPVEMTLLPPPAPRVRPATGRLGGPAATVQRAGSDDGAFDGGRLGGDAVAGDSEDGGIPDGSSLLAASPGAFPVLHVDAAPPQSSGLTPGSRVSAAESPVDTSVPARPSSTDGRDTSGSTSDGAATYVPLPSAPAVQRTSTAAADSSPHFRQVPHSPRLGLGMPLSFSEPAASSESFTGTAPDVMSMSSPGPYPLPVQRTPTLQPPAGPVVLPAADAANPAASNREAANAILPDTGAGTAAGTTTPAAEPSEPPPVDSAPAPDPGLGGPVPEADAGTPEGTPSLPSKDAPPSVDGSAPLLSTDMTHGILDPAADSSAGPESPAPRAPGGNPASMPVVSRSVSIADPVSGVGDGDHAPDAVETFDDVPALSYPAVPEADRSVSEPSAPALTAHPDTLRDGERPTAAAPLPLASAPAAGQTVAAGSPAVQRSSADEVPAETAVAEMSPPAESLVATQGPSARRSADGPRTSGQTEAGNPASEAPSSPSVAVGIQRTAKPGDDMQTRAVPTPAGPVVLRIVPSAGTVPAPDGWQRLASLPVAVPAPRAQDPAVVQRTATLPTQSPANTAGPVHGHLGLPAASTAFAATAAMFAGSDNSGSYDAGTGVEFDLGARTETGHGAEAASRAEPDDSPGPTTAVGRVIQRTISVAQDSAEGSGSMGGALTGFPAGSAAPVQMLTVPPASVLPRGGELPASLQRLSAFTPTVPGTGPGAQAVPGYGSHTSPTTLLSLATSALQRAEGDEAAQRARGTPEYGAAAPASAAPAPEAPAAATSAPEETDGRAGVQGGPAAEAAGAAAQGPATRGAAASGTPAGATPEQLEELAKRLAGPLIRRIKAEMLLDRERRGLRTDTN